ncbi:hypothetical protein C4D60_Mb03t00360 [Musa balbisiana]|uniref:Uncharacterized protein n=1 Tax=Musa balbisiana TaxID=52838 RepID=A0A4S8J7I6_MUSBA|nr:hypothetical protein C4D60_Mb03t00360 [Musa balbisiana]
MALIVDCHQKAGDLRAQSLKEERKRNHHCGHGLNFEMLAMSIRSRMGTAFATLNSFLILLVTEMFGFTDLMHAVLLLRRVRWFHTVGSDHEKFDVLDAFTCQATTSFCSQKQAWFFSSFHRFLFYERLRLLALEFLESTGPPISSRTHPIPRKQCFCLIPVHFKVRAKYLLP